MTALRRTPAKGGVPARSREYYEAALREYHETYGEMTAASFSPGAAKRAGRSDLVERYYAPRRDGTAWPSLNSIKHAFGGSFDAARVAIGLEPNSTAPARGRRSPGEAKPILDVRERRVVVPANDSQLRYLRRELTAATRRAERAERLLDQAQSEPRIVRVDDGEKIKTLRDRLADEKARRREVERALRNAEGREGRARARAKARPTVVREPVYVETESPRALGEVDRLTDRLATAEALADTLRGRLDRAAERAEELRKERDAALVLQDETAGRLREIRREAVERAATDAAVRAAERRAEAAERRAAELAEILVGQRRVPTAEEMDALRSDGPAGERVFIAMVKRIARADGNVARKAAIRDAIAAGLNWSDRL